MNKRVFEMIIED